MKYLKKIFESNSDKNLESILDTFVGVSDEYGEPKIIKGPKGSYTLSWKVLDLKLKTLLIDVVDLVQNKIKYNYDQYVKLTGIQHYLIPAKGRLNFKYDILSELVPSRDSGTSVGVIFLNIVLVPKGEGFIHKFENGVLYLNKKAIEEFLSVDGNKVNISLEEGVHRVEPGYIAVGNLPHWMRDTEFLLRLENFMGTRPNLDRLDEFINYLSNEMIAKKVSDEDSPFDFIYGRNWNIVAPIKELRILNQANVSIVLV